MRDTSSKWHHPLSEGLPQSGYEIEEQSFNIIKPHLDGLSISGPERNIVKRVVHATADISFAKLMRIHPHAVRRGVEALQG